MCQCMTLGEYRERYRKRVLDAGCLPCVADAAADAAEPSDEDLEVGDPEGDAENEMSNWDDDGP